MTHAKTTDALVLNTPIGHADQLILLFHGVGATPDDMAPFGRRLAAEFPRAAIVSVAGRQPVGMGYQWFSVAGITEDNRPARIADAMPAFVATVNEWQARTGVTPHATALIGFSQGAIMALESTRLEPTLGSRVVALSGRFAGPVDHAPPATTLHFIHGKQDSAIHYGHTVRAAERLIQLGADVTADVIPYLGHQVTSEVEALAIERLKGYVPQRLLKQALDSAPPAY